MPFVIWATVNLLNHMKDGKLDTEKLARTVKTAIRMLDNVIDINYYSVPQAEKFQLQTPPYRPWNYGFSRCAYMNKKFLMLPMRPWNLRIVCMELHQL